MLGLLSVLRISQMWKKNRKEWTMKDWLLGVLLSTVAVFAPIKELFLVTTILIMVDLITGILAAKKRGEWTKLKEIKSAGLRRTFSKSWIYLTGIGIGFLIEHYMLQGFIPISKIAAGYISLVEGKSIYENLDVINAQPIFKQLVQKLGSVNDIKQIAEQAIQESKPEEKKDGESL